MKVILVALARLDQVLWVGGAQWAGKTTVARVLAVRFPLVVYAYDYHDARSHSARARAEADRFPRFHAFLDALDYDADSVWSRPSPEQMADRAQAIFGERFQMVLEDLAALPEQTPVLAEGWGLRPDLVAPQLQLPEQAIFLVPSESFRQSQLDALERAQRLSTSRLREPARAQRNRVERDRLLAADVVVRANALGLPLLEVDGTEDEMAIAERVEKQFRPFLPTWLY
ncbi:MAG: hypothetical protein ACJ752_04650 [Gaiellaceae bacterium]